MQKIIVFSFFTFLTIKGKLCQMVSRVHVTRQSQSISSEACPEIPTFTSIQCTLLLMSAREG